MINLPREGIDYDKDNSAQHKFQILSRSSRPQETTTQLCFTLSDKTSWNYKSLHISLGPKKISFKSTYVPAIQMYNFFNICYVIQTT